MAIVLREFVHQSEVEAAIQRAERALGPNVIRIRHNFGSDWSGEPSIFFRVLLSDKASRPDNLKEIAERASLALMNEVGTDECGIHAYFNFRSESEQAALMEPAWA